jgi:hypothetical protein
LAGLVKHQDVPSRDLAVSNVALNGFLALADQQRQFACLALGRRRIAIDANIFGGDAGRELDQMTEDTGEHIRDGTPVITIGRHNRRQRLANVTRVAASFRERLNVTLTPDAAFGRPRSSCRPAGDYDRHIELGANAVETDRFSAPA